MPTELLPPQLQALVAAAGLATACSLIDAVQTRVWGEARPSTLANPSTPTDRPAHAPLRARLLLPPTR